MGAGTIVATAVSIVLLIITGYILIGGTISTARVVALAQQAAADRQAEKLNTRIEIFSAVTNVTDGRTYIEVNNTGSTTITDFDHLEIYLLQGGSPYTYLNQSGPFTWTYTIDPPDLIHPGILDPDESMNITVPYDPDPLKGPPLWVQVTTANGVYASRYTVVV